MLELMLESESLNIGNGNCVEGFLWDELEACGVDFQGKIRTYYVSKLVYMQAN